MNKAQIIKHEENKLIIESKKRYVRHSWMSEIEIIMIVQEVRKIEIRWVSRVLSVKKPLNIGISITKNSNSWKMT